MNKFLFFIFFYIFFIFNFTNAQQTLNSTWISGSNSINQYGIYGTQGIASSSNIPGSRAASISWIDSNNNFWLFGGDGFGINGNIGNEIKYELN